MERRQFLYGAAAALQSASALPAGAAAKPKVRAITAFLSLDRARYRQQIQETLEMLRKTKSIIERGGYEVESLRITTQPFPEYIGGLSTEQALRFFREYDALAIRESFDPNIGPAMVRAGDSPAAAELLGEILSNTKTLEGSLIVGGEEGVYWNSIRVAANLIKFVEDHSPGSAGNFNFAATAMLAPYAPFYPGSYHIGHGRRFAIGAESANVVAEVFAQTAGDVVTAAERLSRALGAHAAAIEKLGAQAEKETGWQYVGLDPTPAPLHEVSIGAAIEKFTGAQFGSSGTMTAAAVITQAVKALPIKRTGYAGLMLPVLEDSTLARRWSEGCYGMDALLAYSAVCGTGLDTIPLPGDISVEQIQRILADVATLACRWKKPLSARLLPVRGKKQGDRTEFDDPFLVNAAIQPLK